MLTFNYPDFALSSKYKDQGRMFANEEAMSSKERMKTGNQRKERQDTGRGLYV